MEYSVHEVTAISKIVLDSEWFVQIRSSADAPNSNKELNATFMRNILVSLTAKLIA